MTTIELQNLSLRTGNKQLLDSVSLTIQQGERVAIVGPNGAGKTTLLRCLLGFVSQMEGTVTLQGHPLTTLGRKEIARMIGYVPQQLGHDIPFTVREFITMSRYAHATHGTITPKDPESETIATQSMEHVGISHLAHQTMSTLSGGERQKANIAAALARQTPILVLDEPSAHLDPKQRESVQQLLGSLGKNRDLTLLCVTHDLNWAAMDFDRIIGMSGGKIIADAPPSAFLTTENLERIFNARWAVQTHPESGHPYLLPSRHTHQDPS